MTPQEFERLLKPGGSSVMYTAADGMRLAEALAGLDERQRQKLSTTAKATWRELTSGPYSRDKYEFAGLGVLGVGSLADARKVAVEYLSFQEAAAIKLLIDRRPEWIDEWVRHKLEDDYPRLSWRLMRALINAGVCRKPETPGYAASMSGSLMVNFNSQVPLSERLMNDPDLLPDVWRFFEQDVCPFHDGSEWIPALCELSSQGIIDRQRLLDATLDSLFHDVSNAARGGYVRFYRSLRATPEERAARQPVFLELLSHRSSSVVKFALDELTRLDKQNSLDGEAFLASGGSVFALKPKSQPVAALKLAASVANRNTELIPSAISFVSEGLMHDSADVQGQTLSLLERWQDRLHQDHLVEIRERSLGLAATTRKQAETLLASAGSQTASQPNVADPPGVDRVHWLSLVAGLDTHWRRLAGVDDVLEAIECNRLPPPLEFRLLDVPVLTGTEPVHPIQSVDELLDATAHSIEIVESADEIERILDGISRLCDQRPADFELRAAPIIARLEGGPARDALRGLLDPYWVPEFVRRVVRCWLTRQPYNPVIADQMPHSFQHLDYIHAFIDARAEEIARRVQLDRPAPMLSAPTHQSGWLEPCEFVRRLKQFGTFDEFPVADVIQALLRLAPDNRTRALADARELAGDVGRAVRWALGGDDGPVPEDRDWFAVWLAAGRARNPYGELKELASLLPNGDAALAIYPAKYDWQPVQVNDHLTHYRPGGAVDLQMQVNSPDTRSPELSLWPTVALCQLLHGPKWGFTVSWAPSWKAQWLTSIWPLNCESRLAAGAAVLCQRVNAPASSLEPNYIYLMPLLEPDRPWSELAYLACWIALISKDADSRGLGIDCMVQAIDDGRATADQAADVLVRLLPGGWVKLNRVANTLEEIALVSPHHTWWTANLLQGFLARLTEFPRDGHHLLTLLLELLSDLGLPLAPQTTKRLNSIRGGGKAAILIRHLLKLPNTGKSEKLTSALQRALDGRIARAIRWSQPSADSRNRTGRG